MVEADSGAIGGKDSHEFILLADSGEDTIILCESCDYAANAEKARFTKTSQPVDSLERAGGGPHPRRQDDRGAGYLLGIPTSKTLKAVFYVADGDLVFVTLRGDLEVNEVKLRNVLQANELRLATADEVREPALSRALPPRLV